MSPKIEVYKEEYERLLALEAEYHGYMLAVETLAPAVHKGCAESRVELLTERNILWPSRMLAVIRRFVTWH